MAEGRELFPADAEKAPRLEVSREDELAVRSFQKFANVPCTFPGADADAEQSFTKYLADHLLGSAEDKLPPVGPELLLGTDRVEGTAPVYHLLAIGHQLFLQFYYGSACHSLALPFELRLLVMKRASTHFAETLLPRLFAAADATAPPTPLQFFESCAASVFEFVSRAHHANPAVAARGWALICSERFEAKGISWEAVLLACRARPAAPAPAPAPAPADGAGPAERTGKRSRSA